MSSQVFFSDIFCALRIFIKSVLIIILHLFILISVILLIPLRFIKTIRIRLSDFILQTWARGICIILNIRILKKFDMTTPRKALLFSNHSSVLDIFAYSSIFPVRFVSRSDIRKWPLIGWMAEQLGIIFLNRKSGHSLLESISRAKKEIDEGANVLVFPEGTSSDGTSILPIKSSFLSLTESGTRTEIYFIQYDQVNGKNFHPKELPRLYYANDVTLFSNILYIMGRKQVDVKIFNLPALTTGLDRKTYVSKLKNDWQHLIQLRLDQTAASNNNNFKV